MIIDAHHHFWRYTPEEYPWISGALSALRRDFLPEHLAFELAAAEVDGVVSVQARQTLEETRWLLKLADEHRFIKGVVGWVDLAAPRLEADLAPLAGHTRLKGLRHSLQGPDGDAVMRAESFHRGLGLLRRFGLRYDLLIHERHLPAAIQLVDRHPQQVFIVDHLAKPRIKAGVLSPWRELLRELARRDNVYGKLSGLVTEADWRAWTPGQLRPYFDTALEAFGARRLMFGSDWPVCLAACDYGRWRRTVDPWLAALAPAEQARIMGGTAVEAYGLKE